MDINRINQNRAAGAYGPRRTNRSGDTPDAEGTARSASDAPGAGDGVQLSDQAQVLSRASAVARAAPDVRVALVDQLRNSIQSGRYQIDDAAIAQKMLEDGA